MDALDEVGITNVPLAGLSRIIRSAGFGWLFGSLGVPYWIRPASAIRTMDGRVAQPD